MRKFVIAICLLLWYTILQGLPLPKYQKSIFRLILEQEGGREGFAVFEDALNTDLHFKGKIRASAKFMDEKIKRLRFQLRGRNGRVIRIRNKGFRRLELYLKLDGQDNLIEFNYRIGKGKLKSVPLERRRFKVRYRT